MTCPGTYPTVLNGQIYFYDSSTAEYECLSGFYMSGNKVITCSAGVWQTAPTCDVIRQYDNVDVFPNWWLFLVGVLIVLMVLACFLCLLCYFCRNRHHGDGCCGGCCEQRRAVHVAEEMDNGGVFYVPVTSTPTQARYLSAHQAPTKTRSTTTDDLGKRTTAVKSTTTDHQHISENNHRVYHYGGTATATLANGTDLRSESYAWHERHGSKTSGSGSKAWKDSSNVETRSDGDWNEGTGKPRQPAKEVRAWMPHSHSVRKINTSTK